MISAKRYAFAALILILSSGFISALQAEDGLTVTPAADFNSRYIWRGIQMNDGPNIQPSVTLGIGALELGLWGSSTLTNNNADDDFYAISQEVDLWVGYTFSLKNGMTIGGLLTDYYFPHGGIRMGNYNNWDHEDGPGAHTLEAGLILAGPSSFPVTLSVYRNVHNDSGSNSYFQIDYSTAIRDVSLDLFAGAAGGSKDNPAFYGTDDFNFINIGFSAGKSVKISDNFSLPVTVSYVVNPRMEIGYLLFGFSL